MSTIINTPGNNEDASATDGWAVAVIILLVVIGAGAFLWFQYRMPTETTSDTNINVTLPDVSLPTTENPTLSP
jgi:protein-S-isoprenylcysteine O-methyltransferase Ste14